MLKNFSIFFLIMSTLMLASIKNAKSRTLSPILGDTISRNTTVKLVAEEQAIIRNPLMGWAIYSDAYNPDFKFWEKFDAVNVSDYATHLYIRWPWSAFESEEGVYAWDSNPFFRLLTEGAKSRGLKLAFRIYVDSHDYTTSSTPDYVRKAGADGFNSNTGKWSPYPDDIVFQTKYEQFLRAFAEKYDDPDVVDYIDGFGLGRWGEGHSFVFKNPDNFDKTFDWIVNLYGKSFKRVLLAINYHIDINEQRLNRAFTIQDYILRHDAFGMAEYYGEFERSMVAKQFPGKPIIAESGWWQNGSIHWKSDPNGYNDWRDVWDQTLKDALNERANILDLRNISETRSWLETSPDLVQKFIEKGGYRLYPDKISIPQSIQNKVPFTIVHRWNNLAVGVCPNNNSRWNHKYKVAFALLDHKTGKPRKILIDEKADPSEWLLGSPKEYIFETVLNDVPQGDYTLAVAIIDKSKNNIPGLNLAVKGTKGGKGWISLKTVTLK